MLSEKQMLSLADLDLSAVPDIEGRRAVAAALDAYNATWDRQSEATRPLYRTKSKLEAAAFAIARKIRVVEQSFDAEFDAVCGYPDIDSPYRMHDDHLGCYRCSISGLPLRHDDKTVEWEDGEALACLAAMVEPETEPEA